MVNCYVRRGELEKAAEFYHNALALGEDEDARYNLDLVMEALRQKRRSEKGSKGEKEEKKGEKKSTSSASASKESTQTPGMNKSRTESRKLSRSEERKWMRLIENQPLKSRLYPLVPAQEENDETPW
jgi:Ca-activated chloride channel family protein